LLIFTRLGVETCSCLAQGSGANDPVLSQSGLDCNLSRSPDSRPQIEAGLFICYERCRAMAAIEDIGFAWAIGKALLIVIVAFGILLYAAWEGTRRMPRSSAKPKLR
jgi:hypothetical protein